MTDGTKRDTGDKVGRIRSIIASLLGEDPDTVPPAAPALADSPVDLPEMAMRAMDPAFGSAEAQSSGGLLDAAARAVGARLERWGQGDAVRRFMGGVERDVLTGPGEWVELAAQVGVAGKLSGTARLTIDRVLAAEIELTGQRSIRAMVRAPEPGLHELGVELEGLDFDLLGHRILQVATGRPLVLIDADLLLPRPDGQAPVVPPRALISALLDADLELAYFDVHGNNRRAAIHAALELYKLPRAATLLFVAEVEAVEHLGLDFARLFELTALRRYLARGVPIAAMVSERFVSTLDLVPVIRPELALERGRTLDFAQEHVAAREFIESRGVGDRARWRLDQATGTERVAGNRFHAELDNARARARLFELIDAAESSIHLQFYQLRPGDFCEALVVKLIQRARAGVQVRLMVDALYSEQDVLGMQNPLLRSFETEPRVAVLALNPIGTRHDVDLTRLKQRDHRKILVVDGRLAWVSGRNAGDVHYVGFDELPIHDYTPHDRIPWLDAHIEVEGPLVTEVQRAFLATWAEQGGPAPVDREALIPTLSPAGTSNGRLVVHHGLADANGLAMYETLLDLAEDHVILVNDFPIVATLEQAILRLLARGVRVELLTGNAAARRDDGSMFPARIHRTLFEHMVKARLEPLIQAGVEVYEFTTIPSPEVVARGGRVRPYVHAKLVSVDGKLCSIGSANFDATASFWENEANVVVEDPAFVTALEAQLRTLIDASLRLDLASTYWRSERTQRAVVGTLWPVSIYS